MITAGVLVVAAAGLFAWLTGRPQRGLLLLAALVPFHGLLVLVPAGDALAAWKEVLLGLTLLATFLTRERRTPPPAMPWWPAAAAFVGFGVVSALWTLGLAGAIAIKVTFFYLLIPVIVYRSPLTRTDRDRLVSIVMATGVLTAAVGIWQQIVGPDALADLGYAWNEQIRTSNGVLRSFSTFTSPFPFAFFVMIALILGVAVALGEPGRLRNKLFLCATPLLLIGMGTSIVRASLVGAIIGIAWLALHRYRGLWGALGALAIAAVLAALALRPDALAAFGSSDSFGTRSAGWQSITGRLLAHPLGQGLGSTGQAAVRATEGYGVGSGQPPPAASVGAQDLAAGAYQPDNYFVKIGLELGPVGLWLFLLLMVAALLFTLRAARGLTGPDSAFALGVSATIVAGLAASAFSTYFEIFPMDAYFWLLLGAVGCAKTSAMSGSGRWHGARTAVGSPPISGS